MPHAAVLAIDQGTTGTRAVVVDASGRIVAEGRANVPQHYPQPGWVEHDLEQIWESVLAAVGQAMARLQDGWSGVRAIGITNQRETVGIWERASGRPVARAIVWQCRRTAALCAELRARAGARVRELTGLTVDPYFSGPKLRWLLDNVEDLRPRTSALAAGTMDTWLVWRLTGGAHVTDPTNASRTMLFDIDRRQWSEELLDLIGVPHGLLPEVRPSGAEFAVTSGCQGIPDGIPIRAIMGDQQAALFGQGCVSDGSAKNTYGTGCFLLTNTADRRVDSRAGLLTTIACDATGAACYALEGSVFIGGAVVQWLRDGLGIIASAEEVEDLARSVPDTGGVYLVPAFVGLGAPYWDPQARGAILGLTRGTSRAHIARAALEAIAHQSTDVLEAMAADGATIQELKVDGGASANNLLMQMQADLAGVPVVRAREVEMTALGAAYLAGIGVGLWEAPWQAQREALERFAPQISDPERRTRRAQWHEAVSRVRVG